MINNRQSLADFCLRQLGGGVVNIEVTPEQIEDSIELSVEFYQEYHFDGVERDYYKHRVTGTKLYVTDVTGYKVGEVITGTITGVFASILEINTNDNTIVISKMKPKQNQEKGNLNFVNQFQIGENITNGNIQTLITNVLVGDIDKEYIDINDNDIVGVLKIINLSSVMSSGDYMFNAQYQIMMQEIQNLSSGGTQYLYGAMQYLSHLDFVLRKEKDFRFNRRWGKLYLDINWNYDVTVGDFIIVEVYRALNDSVVPKMLNDRWLKEYATAQIKKIWGINLKKYSGMTLPGGLQYNGQQIYDEAMQQIKELEDFAINSSAPLEFCIG